MDDVIRKSSNNFGNSVVADWVQRRATEHPQGPALLASDAADLSNLQLQAQCSSIANLLGECGIGPAARIAVFHSGGADMAALITAVWTHCAAVPVNTSATNSDWERWLVASSATAVAIEDGEYSTAIALANKLGLPVFLVRKGANSIAGRINLVAAHGNPAPAATNGQSDLRLVLATSGTSGEPKLVPVHDRHLQARVEQIAGALELGRDDRCVSLMSLAHVGGLSAGLATNLFAGCAFAALQPGEAHRTIRDCGKLGATYVAAPYTVFHDIARISSQITDDIAALRPALRMLRTGAGHLDYEAANRLEQQFGVPVVEAYGSSETGFMATTMKHGRRDTPGYVGHSAGSEISIRDSAFLPVEDGGIGEVWVRGANVIDDYLLAEQGKRNVFTGDWYRTGDLGAINSEGALVLAGRKSDLINRGGVLVSPQPIEEAARAWPGVQEAVCFPVPHPTLGEDIALAIISAANTKIQVGDMRRQLARSLPASSRPQSIVLVEEVPRSTNGKIVRRLLAKELSPTTPLPDDEFQGDTERLLASIWRDVLRIEQVGRNDDFFALGGDSLKALEVFLTVEQQLGIRLPRSVVFEAGTIATLAEKLEQRSDHSCVVPIKPDGSETPLFCIHGQDGGVIVFRELAERLPAEQPFYGIQSPWLAGQTERFDSMETLARHYAFEIRDIQPKGPYRIAGYSMGGRVALAVAEQLRKAGDEVEILLLLDSYSGIGRKQNSWMTRWRINLANWRNASGSDRSRLLLNKLRRPFVESSAIIRRLHKRLLLAIDRRDAPLAENLTSFVNARLNNSYVAPTYSGRVVLLRLDDHGLHPDIYDGWNQVCTGSFTTRVAQGSHLHMFAAPTVDEVAAIICDELALNQA